MKILISFLARSNDFYEKNNEVKEEGPTYVFHQHFYQHDKHLILSTAQSQDNDLRAELLRSKLQKDFPKHKVETKYLNIADVIDLGEVKSKLETLLLSHREHEIDIFFSPGTSIMQLSWYILHTSLGLKTNLLQTRKAKDSNASKPELIYLSGESSVTPYSVVIREKEQDRRDVSYLITSSIKPVYALAEKVAAAEDTTTLILGESGTGKEHLASFIHMQSARKSFPFVKINCSAFTDQLLESRLFGYKKGAFTGAEKDHKGLFEQAAGGTIFLDEIGDISPYMQQSLLRILQEKEITPVGGTPTKIDVRIIAATNKDLIDMCEKGDFRWDLFYRLSVVDLKLPSLLIRGKKELKEMLIFFIRHKQKKFNRRKAIEIQKDALEMMLNYHFPGNIRELENLVERFYVLCEQEVMANDIPEHINNNHVNAPLLLAEVEKKHILYTLDLFKGNQRQTTLALGISLNTLKKKLKEYHQS